MPSELTNEATRSEWRKLGFFHERDDSAKEWRIAGSRDGLQAFAQILRQYASKAENNAPSEHHHYGPYMYLEIGTWGEPQITDHWIAGPMSSLLRLSSIVEEKIATANVGDVLHLRDVWAPDQPYDLVLDVQGDQFDPARADSSCW